MKLYLWSSKNKNAINFGFYSHNNPNKDGTPVFDKGNGLWFTQTIFYRAMHVVQSAVLLS